MLLKSSIKSQEESVGFTEFVLHWERCYQSVSLAPMRGGINSGEEEGVRSGVGGGDREGDELM